MYCSACTPADSQADLQPVCCDAVHCSRWLLMCQHASPQEGMLAEREKTPEGLALEA